MKKKMWIAAGLALTGCFLGVGGMALAAMGGEPQATLLSVAEDNVWESSGDSSRRETEARWQERVRETAEAFSIYEEFGMTYDREQNRFFYNGKMVRHFSDQIGESSNAFHHGEGVIDVIPLRDDGGNLTGLREASREEFEERTKSQEELQAQFPSDLEEDACMELGGLSENFRKEYEIYEPFGLAYEEEGDGLFFEGEKVRYFLDGAEVDEGCLSVWKEYLNEEGTVDVHTVRAVIDNGDGSYDPFGELLRIERYSREEFERRELKDFYGSLEATASDMQDQGGGFFGRLFGKRDKGASFEEIFEKYRDYGITYVEAAKGSGAGNVYYDGELVIHFVDQTPEGGVFSFHSADISSGGEDADGNGIRVSTVYDGEGKLCGVRKED